MKAKCVYSQKFIYFFALLREATGVGYSWHLFI